jgi:CRISPR-associated protein Cmr1
MPPDVNPYQDIIERNFSIEVITPMFGGGVEPGVNDLSMLIRPTSIRGHLRFWWRATRGVRFNDIKELFQREGEIWGSTENPSPVIIEAKVDAFDKSTECARYDKPGKFTPRWCEPFDDYDSSLPYALFPFQGRSPDNANPEDPAEFIRSASFKLIALIPTDARMATLRSAFNEQRKDRNLSSLNPSDDNILKDVEASIWAWVNFGGIGARTRRGCGALFCREPGFVPQSIEEIDYWYGSNLEKFGIKSFDTRKWPTIPRTFLLQKANEKPLVAWNSSVKLLRDFRQGKRIGRNPGMGITPGRSFWPEPESIRNLTGYRLKKHDPLDMPANAFPRAEFGLPIVFHFKDDNKGEPKETQLYPKGSQRMNSPLILRPLAIGSGKMAVAMVMRMTTSPVREIELKLSKNKNIPFGEKSIRDPKLANYLNSPMKTRSRDGSALDAFMFFAEHERKFLKVSA